MSRFSWKEFWVEVRSNYLVWSKRDLRKLGFLVIGMAFVYIANIHHAERKARAIDRMTRQMEEVRWEYMNIKADLMFLSKQTEVAERVRDLGLKESRKPPMRLEVKKD